MPGEGDRRVNPDTGAVEVYRNGQWVSTSGGSSTSTATADKPDIRNIDGYPHERGPDGRYYPVEIGTRDSDSKGFDKAAAGFTPAPTSSYTGSGGGGGYAGPTATSLLNASIDRERMAQDQAQFDVNAQLERAGLAEQMRQFDLEYAAQGEEMAFLEDKFRVEEELGRKAEARASQALMEQIAARQEDNRFRYEQLRQQAQQAEIQNQLAIRDQQMQEQEMARRAEGERQDRLRATNMDIASLSADPGDRGALAGAMLGGELLGTQIAEGADFRTAESLGPLDQLLGLRDQLMNPRSGQPGGGGGGREEFDDLPWFNPGFGALGEEAQNAQRATWLGNVNAAANEQGLTSEEMVARGNPGISQNARAAGTHTDWSKVDARGMPIVAAANGFDGIVDDPTQFIVGEGGAPERVTVTPLSGVPQAPDTMTQDRPARALTWLDQVTQRASRGTPFQQDVSQGRLPTPIGVSAPGTSPYVQRLAGSITASATGTPLDAFLAEIMRVMPWGVNAGIVGRSA
jgi:hypothetical protein